MLIGTRSWSSGSALPPNLQKRDESTVATNGQTSVPVTVYERRIRYHWPFAIPAFLSLSLFIAVLLAALVSTFSGRGAPARVRHYLFHLSSGRLLGSLQYPNEGDRHGPTNEWIARVGNKPIDLQYLGAGGGHATTPFLNHQPVVGSGKSDGVAQTTETPPGVLRHVKDHPPQLEYSRVPAND